MQEFYLLKRKQAMKSKTENPGCKAAKCNSFTAMQPGLTN
jgi:hypothetical protein